MSQPAANAPTPQPLSALRREPHEGAEHEALVV